MPLQNITAWVAQTTEILSSHCSSTGIAFKLEIKVTNYYKFKIKVLES
jgi:hypothetical protein